MSIKTKERKYSKKIFEIIEKDGNTSELIRLIKLIARDTDLLTFEERLERSKEQDLY